jgi:hypothetical protein
VGDAELSVLPLDIESVPRRSLEALNAPTSTDGIPLTVNCYVTQLAFGLPGLPFVEKGKRYPRCLFEFAHPKQNNKYMLTTAVPGPGRALLQLVPTETAGALHAASREFRESVGSAVSVGLKNLESLFKVHGHEQLAKITDTYGESEKLALSRQLQLWTRRILRDLLGADVQNVTKRKVISKRMSFLLPHSAPLQNFLTMSFGRPARLDGPHKRDWMIHLSELNEVAISEIGKSIFEIDKKRDRVEYLGLWGLPRTTTLGT